MNKRFPPFKFTPVDALVIAFVCLFSLAIAQLVGSNSRYIEYRTKCQNNLFNIGRAMQIYANDYDDVYPRAGGRSSQWSNRIPNYRAPNRYLAYQIRTDGVGGYVTISASLYLLIKYAELLPDSFVCPGDYGATVFNLADEGIYDRTLTELWDFGPYITSWINPSNHYSYAYHMPYCEFHLTTSSEPGMAVAADRNPWLTHTDTEAHFSQFDPDGNRESIKAGNTIAHLDEGQNVLFVDGHVSFETEPFCGVNVDNIYTPCNDRDPRIGCLPKSFFSEPASSTDSFLANEPVIYRKYAIQESKDVNSIDLQQTLITLSLDFLIPEHKNIIWCSVFQLAWDKLKDDIIGEPVEVIGAEDLTTYLNWAIVSQEDLEKESYYASAGLIGEGIIEQIQTDMNQFFPSEHVFFLREGYNTDPNSILAYSYLNLNIESEYPFYRNSKSLAFVDSKGTSTDVTSFCNFSEFEFPTPENTYKQVEVLFGKFDNMGTSTEFAVDLCKYTQPYQVILALLSREISPRQDTLGHAIDYVESRISKFRLDPDYDYLRELWLIDELIVPDFLFKITHHFSELEGQGIGNQPWQDQNYCIHEAMQIIDFSINQTSIVVEPSGIYDIDRPSSRRHFYFNRPFLIYVKKRGDDYSPIFAMWVDNAELMNLYQDD